MNNWILLSVLVFTTGLSCLASAQQSDSPSPGQITEEKELQALYPGYRGVDDDYVHGGKESLEKWQDCKYGLRIHWGIYSMVGGHESWCLNGASREFQKIYHTMYHFFNPTDFDPDEWMELITRGGMKYFTFTTKHHDGFCMWPTKTLQLSLRQVDGVGKYEDCVINYSVMDTPYKKDIIGMLVDAARRHGLGVGLYYSHIDWHDYDFGWDTRNAHYDSTFTKESDPDRWQAFIEKERAQLTELLTGYGDIDLLSLDTGGIGWPEEAQSDCYSVAKMCRSLQPKLLMRHRGIGPYGDYGTPERWIPQSLDGDFDIEGRKSSSSSAANKPWQVIYPCGQAFSWLPNDKYKPASWILESLIDIVSKGGNFQVAFGPMPNGEWNKEQIKRIEYVGDWLRVNGDAIYKTRPWVRFHEGENIRFTRSKDWKYLYAICMKWPGMELRLGTVKAKKGADIVMLGYGYNKPLKWRQDENGLMIEIPAELQAENKRPCKQAWVLRIESEKP